MSLGQAVIEQDKEPLFQELIVSWETDKEIHYDTLVQCHNVGCWRRKAV